MPIMPPGKQISLDLSLLLKHDLPVEFLYLLKNNIEVGAACYRNIIDKKPFSDEIAQVFRMLKHPFFKKVENWYQMLLINFRDEMDAISPITYFAKTGNTYKLTLNTSFLNNQMNYNLFFDFIEPFIANSEGDVIGTVTFINFKDQVGQTSQEPHILVYENGKITTELAYTYEINKT